jgi:hypothetical protein
MSFHIAFQVHIFENRNLTHLHVPALRHHEISVEDGDGDDKDASRDDLIILGGPPGRRAVVQYRPKLLELQRRLRSHHALQFVVQYDVDRKEKAGEIQVS